MKFTKLLGLFIATISLGLAGCNPDKPSQPAEVVYTAEKVSSDFNANLAADGIDVKAEYDEEHKVYGLAVGLAESDDESEDNLSLGASVLASYLPDYMGEGDGIYGDPSLEDYFDLFGDQSFYYYLEFTSPDKKSGVAIVSYIYNSLLVAQIEFADLAE